MFYVSGETHFLQRLTREALTFQLKCLVLIPRILIQLSNKIKNIQFIKVKLFNFSVVMETKISYVLYSYHNEFLEFVRKQILYFSSHSKNNIVNLGVLHKRKPNLYF